MTFDITSIDAAGASTDPFETANANLCQFANRREYPNSYEGRDYKYEEFCIKTTLVL